jgi:signal peptidase I
MDDPLMKFKDMWDIVKLMIYAVILVWIVNNFIFVSYGVEGKSMLPTLEDGDQLFVNILGYNLKGLDRLDTIVFEVGEEDHYVKRVIGIPGDSVWYKNDILYINGEAIPEPYLTEQKFFLGKYNLMSDFSLADHPTVVSVVPKDKLFVLGDNRLNSVDSRIFGFVDVSSVVGIVEYKYFPISRFGKVE